MLSKLSPSNEVKSSLWFEEDENEDQEENTKCSLLYSNDRYQIEKFCEIDLNLCTFLAEHLRQVKLLNSSSLPVNYDERFYADYLNFQKIQHCSDIKNILSNKGNPIYWTKLAYYSNLLVGALFSKIDTYDEKNSESSESESFYAANVHTLACLPTFRRRGVGSILLNKLIEFCESQNHLIVSLKIKTEPKLIKKIFLHCQTINEDAIGFYNSFKFDIVRRVEGYYRRMKSPDAYRMERCFF